MRSDIDALVGGANPVTRADVDALRLDGAAADLMEEIVSTPMSEPDLPGQLPGPWITARRATTLLGAAALVASVLFVTQSTSEPNTAWSTEMIEFAESAPRILVDDPDWTIESAYDSNPHRGDLYLSNGAYELEFSWSDTIDYRNLVDDRRSDGLEEEQITVLGNDGLLFPYGGTDFEAFWTQDGHGLRVRGDAGSREAFDELLGDLEEVGVDVWLSAMPEDFILAVDNSEAIAEIAANVPVPDYFDSWIGDRLNRIDPDEPALTTGVMHWAACSWVRAWVAWGRDDGAPKTVPHDEIVENLSAVYDWSTENSAVTDESVWAYTEAIVSGESTVDGRSMAENAPEDLRCGGW